MPSPLPDPHLGNNWLANPNGRHHGSVLDKADAPTSTPTVPGYEILSELSQSSRAIVYHARDTSLHNEVAIKVSRSSAQETLSQQFIKSAQITAQLQHPGIPPVFHLGTLPDGCSFIVMKLIRGSTLAGSLAARQQPIVDRIRFLPVFEQICQAMAYAHSQRVVHRDLESEHVMIGAFGEVQVTGWGSAAFVGNESSEPQPGSPVGSPSYMPPEQARGEWKLVDERADVFALGGIMCEILTGQPTYFGHSEAVAIQTSAAGDLSEAFERLNHCGEDVELIAIAKRCLSPIPGHRPANASELASLISTYRASQEERIRKTATESLSATLATEKSRRRKAELAVVLVVGLFLIWVGAFIWWEERQKMVREVIGNKREPDEKRPAPPLSDRDRAVIEKKARDAFEQRMLMQKRQREEAAAKMKQLYMEEHTAPPPREVIRPETGPVPLEKKEP